MSDFSGLWRLDGRPATDADVARMGAGLLARGIGPERVWRNGPLALVHRQHVFTAEDRRERLPLVGGSGAVLCADVRLDGRHALLRALGCAADAPELPDGALLLRALEHWGVESALPRLFGDFCFALWDPRTQRLTLARDHAGSRSLFVHRSGNLVAFSTRLRALLSFPDVSRDLDLQSVADHLVLNLNRPERTLYRAIDRVPIGQWATITKDDFRVRSWWSMPEPGTVRRGSDREYEEEARDVLDRAVADALRSIGPVAATLTGGLDSTAVVATAVRRLAPSPLLAVTRVPGGLTAPDSDTNYHNEAPRARALAAMYPSIEWHAVGDDREDWGERDPQRWFIESGGPCRSPMNVAWFFSVYRLMASRGSTVLLNGAMGNAFFSDSGLTLLPKLFLAGRWGGLARHLQALSRTSGKRHFALFASHVLRPLEPLSLRQWRTGRSPQPWHYHSALNPALAAELRLDETLDRSGYRTRTGGGHRSTVELRRWMWQDEVAWDAEGVLRSMSGIDKRRPLADRRVVEFFGSLPLDQFLKDGVTRSLTRRLLQGLAPEATVRGVVSGKQNGDWFARMSARRGEMLAAVSHLRASPIASHVVDLDRMQSLLDDWPRDAAAAEPRRFEYFHLLDRGIEMGRFLAWHDGSND